MNRGLKLLSSVTHCALSDTSHAQPPASKALKRDSRVRSHSARADVVEEFAQDPLSLLAAYAVMGALHSRNVAAASVHASVAHDDAMALNTMSSVRIPAQVLAFRNAANKKSR